ncbi:MAG: glycosyltransferase, partial [Candidatus Kapabacteria bacterium]|nr:glycosyltransferase [Candidatus Kapabacteria bacterium]
YEPSVVHDFDVTTFVSPEDVAAMTGLEPAARYAVVTNGVDLEKFPFRDDFEQRSGLLFAGKLDVLANDLMATMIIRDILPGVHEQLPGTMLTIAGANPGSSLRSMASPYVRIEADVPHLVSYLHSAAIFVHPHHGGSGIQNKVLEAMAAGCPVVTTPSGLQGIEAVHGVHAMVATDAAGMQRHIVTLLRDTDLRRRIAHNARQLMERTHTWQVMGQQLDAVLAAY